MKNQKQRGVNIIDAVFAMVIASMIAAAVTTSLGTWFSVRTMTASQDGANQYAQGIIAKASSVSWDKLGFLPTEGSSNLIDGTCSTAFRPSLRVGDATLHTVTLAEGDTPATGIEQTSVAEVRGKKYCVTTDITWNDGSTSKPASSYGAKNISVKMSWEDRGKKRSIAVSSTRSPNIGEAIPTGISEGHDAESSPIKTFSVTAADNDGTNGRVCYKANWNATGDTVKAVGSTSIGLSPVSTSKTLSSSDKNIEQCFTANNPSYSYYGLQITDSAGPKFVSLPDYQFPGSKVTVSGTKLEWNAYPSSGTTKYSVMQSDNSDFSNPVKLKEVTDSTVTVSPSTKTWFRIDTSNSDYAVTAKSNVVAVEPAPAPTPTPTPTPTWETASKPYTPPATSNPCFTDVVGNQYYKEICWAKDRGISTGWGDGTFGVDLAVNRDTMAAFFYRLSGSPAYTPPATARFSDVPAGAAFYKEINWMADSGISTGWADGTFRPTSPVNRDQMAAFMYRFAGSQTYTVPSSSHFSDVPLGMTFAREMNWMYDAGVSTGYPDGTYKPASTLRRDEMAAFMFNWNYRFGTL